MNQRVLIIEDDPASLRLMSYLLEAYGYTTVTAGRGDLGLALAMSEPLPDVILCDIQLPGLDGRSIAAELKKHPAFDKIPLVAVTALAMVGDRERILAAGFTDYVSKPIDPSSFVTRLEQIMSRA